MKSSKILVFLALLTLLLLGSALMFYNKADRLVPGGISSCSSYEDDTDSCILNKTEGTTAHDEFMLSQFLTYAGLATGVVMVWNLAAKGYKKVRERKRTGLA